MVRTVWLILLIPIGALFTGLGIYAWKREKPMWFNASSPVSERDISDISAFNKANGIMWIAYSMVFWIGTVLAVLEAPFTGSFIFVGVVAGIPVLALVYKKICAKYKR